MATLRDGELETATEMLAALSRGEVTSAELLARAHDRAVRWQPSINAFSQLWDPEPAVAGEAAGVPLAVKDLFDLAGRETTGCCLAYRGNLVERDAAVVARVRERFHPMGKTNQHELAAGGTNLVSACGRTGNPWDPDRMTGGSSGGSGAAVAAGIVPVALGSDTGGSIRIPAALCGTFGLKPTTGQLSLQGVMPLAPTMDCPGPIASTAEDLDLLYRAMTGRAATPSRAAEGATKVAVLEGFFPDVLHEEVRATVEMVASTLEAAGIGVEAIDGSGLGDVRQTWMDVCCPEFAQAHPLLEDPERRRMVADQPREWLERGASLEPEQRKAAARRRVEIAAWFRSRLSGFDALLIPTTAYPAPRVEEERVDLGGGRAVDVAKVGPGYITCTVNLAGLPALNLPAGRTQGGLPLGASLVGHEQGEDTLLHLARAWEEAAGYRPPRPTPPAA